MPLDHTPLEKLELERVVSVYQRDQTTVRFEEECDQRFHVDFNKDDLHRLIAELQMIYNKMK
jgi:hypothetical protein